MNRLPAGEGVDSRLAEKDRQIDALAAIGRVIASTLDPMAIARTVHQQIGRVIPPEKMKTFFFALTNWEAKVHHFLVDIEDGVKNPPSDLPFGEIGLTNWAVQHGEDLFILDGTETWEKRVGAVGLGAEAKSLLLNLVRKDGKILGVISIQSYDQYDAYTADHRRLISIIADQTAVAVENARMFREIRESAISRHLVGELLRDFALQFGDARTELQETGERFSRRVSGSLEEALETFRQQGLGRLSLEMIDPLSRRALFNGRELFSSFESGTVPQDHFAAGFLGGTATRLLGLPFDCEEVECRAMGAELCRFVVYPVDTRIEIDLGRLTAAAI